MSKTQNLMKSVENAAASSPTWADLSNLLFDQESGLIAKAFQTRKQREEFARTDAYKRIRKLLAEARNTHGLVEGATPVKSGRFVVRLPKTLHAALEVEALKEGVSLNQLVVFKLAAQMKGNILKPHARLRASGTR